MLCDELDIPDLDADVPLLAGTEARYPVPGFPDWYAVPGSLRPYVKHVRGVAHISFYSNGSVSPRDDEYAAPCSTNEAEELLARLMELAQALREGEQILELWRDGEYTLPAPAGFTYKRHTARPRDPFQAKLYDAFNAATQNLLYSTNLMWFGGRSKPPLSERMAELRPKLKTP